MSEKYKGDVLKKVREQKGISLEMVHEALKIPMDALRAIEEGYSLKILSPFYLKGFIKIYAKYLEVDINEVVDDFKKEELPKYIKKSVSQSRTPIADIFRGFFTQRRQKQIFVVFVILISLFIITKLVKILTKKKHQNSSSSQSLANENKVDNNNEKIIENVKSVEVQSQSKPKESTKTVVKEEVQEVDATVKNQTKQKEIRSIILTIRTHKNNWLKVRTDGETVFQSSLDKGAVETWRAKDNIEITAKYINELDFEINGKLIGPLSKKEFNSKRVLITKDGIQVLK